MADENTKILLLDYHAEAAEAVADMLQSFDLTFENELPGIAEKGKTGYDLIITGYIVPAVSGDQPLNHLTDVDQALAELEHRIVDTQRLDNIEKHAREQYSQILRMLKAQKEGFEREKIDNELKLKQMAEQSAQAQAAGEQAVAQSKAALKAKEAAEDQRDAALQRATEAERDKTEALQRAMQSENDKIAAENNADAALQAKQAAEDIAREALLEKEKADEKIAQAVAEKSGIIDKLTLELQSLNEQLEATQAIARQTQAEKQAIQDRLRKLQENWENYVR